MGSSNNRVEGAVGSYGSHDAYFSADAAAVLW